MRSKCQNTSRFNLTLLIAGFYCFVNGFAFAETVDLSTWSIIQFCAAGDGDSVWTFSEGGSVATQTENSDPSILLGNFDVSNCRIRGTFAGGNADDDCIGFVFGYQDRAHFYLFEWKREYQSHPVGGISEKGMRIRRFFVDDGSDPTFEEVWTMDNTVNMEILKYNDIGWAYPNEYEFLLDFVPGQFEITVSDVNGVLEHWQVTDSTYLHGRFGFYNFSEPGATYKFIDKQCISSTIFVDDNAPNDPKPNDSTVSDPKEDGSKDHPFDMIQEGIDVAKDGETVIVLDGIYWEAIEFTGQNIMVTSFDPNEPNVLSPYPVIDANYNGTAVTFNSQEDSNCVLEGFIITRGKGDLAGGIHCEGSSPIIANCLIVGNRAFDPNGAALYCVDSNAIFENCTVSGNLCGDDGAGVHFIDSNVVLYNSIVSDNIPGDVLYTGMDTYVVEFTFIGELADTYPLFVQPGYWSGHSDPNTVWIHGDYHLMSEEGHWDGSGWITDSDTSPCIDAGDPNTPVEREPEPNGGRVNMGAYGGTAEASMSPTVE